jgi:peptidyl-tRNA hydrolase
VRSDLSSGLQLAQAVHAAFQFFAEWPSLARAWTEDSNFLVVVAVPDELALADLAARAVEEGIARTIVREPDLDNTITAVALQPGAEARRLCAQLPLALRESAMT